MRRTRTALGALGALCALTLIVTGCSPKEARMSPEETRDALVALVHDSAAKLDATGWDESDVPSAMRCGDGVKWGYTYGAPIPDADYEADAQTVLDYWTSLGITARMDTSHDPVVFGEGGPVQSISFQTGPGSYAFSATSTCAPGNPDDYR